VDLYKKITGKKASEIFDDSDILSHDSRSQSPRKLSEHSSRYYPFQSEIDFTLAQWFLNIECIKENIKRFYKDMCLEQIYQLLSFSSHNELISKIHNIPYDIPDNIWKISKIEIE